jgi:hypothetical protein
MEKKNREQRRREKFGHAGGATKEPWPQSEANPVFGQGDPEEDTDKRASKGATPKVAPDQGSNSGDTAKG